MLIFTFCVTLLIVVSVSLANWRKVCFVAVGNDSVFHGFELLRWFWYPWRGSKDNQSFLDLWWHWVRLHLIHLESQTRCIETNFVFIFHHFTEPTPRPVWRLLQILWRNSDGKNDGSIPSNPSLFWRIGVTSKSDFTWPLDSVKTPPFQTAHR